MGPFVVIGNFVHGQQWAHSQPSATLFIGSNGPIRSHWQFLSWAAMGPFAVIRHAPRWAVYTTNFALFTFIIKHNSRRHNKKRRRMAQPRTQNRNAAHGGDTQRVRHPQTRLSKTGNGQRAEADRVLTHGTGIGRSGNSRESEAST